MAYGFCADKTDEFKVSEFVVESIRAQHLYVARVDYNISADFIDKILFSYEEGNCQKLSHTHTHMYVYDETTGYFPYLQTNIQILSFSYASLINQNRNEYVSC